MATRKPFDLALNERENSMGNKVLDTWITTAERTPTIEILPPGLDKPTWETVIAKFTSILGEDGVLVGHEHRIRYVDPYAVQQDEQEKRGTAATLFPVTVEHVQGVLKVCNEYRIPIWTFSRGKNLGYGGPAARVKVCLVLKHFGGDVDNHRDPCCSTCRK